MFNLSFVFYIYMKCTSPMHWTPIRLKQHVLSLWIPPWRHSVNGLMFFYLRWADDNSNWLVVYLASFLWRIFVAQTWRHKTVIMRGKLKSQDYIYGIRKYKLFDSLSPWRCGCNLKLVFCETHIIVNVGSGNGLVPSGSRPLTESINKCRDYVHGIWCYKAF